MNVIVLFTLFTVVTSVKPSCRSIAGDASWPSEVDWRNLNQTVNGKLVKGVPLGRPCFPPKVEPSKCSKIRGELTQLTPYLNDPVNIMSPYWLNNSCNPNYADSHQCKLGNLAQYAIDVSDASAVIAGLKFAQQKNIRLTIKNTGHDYLGRSAGASSLGLWMSNLKDITFSTYTSKFYTGPAARVGAGVQTQQLLEAAARQKFRLVVGSCPTVGFAGGYLQGGGHSPLSSSYGLGADQTLEFEVITATGQHLNVSPVKNADLYWALSGGGPGNYAVVLSSTIKAYRDGPVAGASFSFVNSAPKKYWSGVSAWLQHLLVLDTIPGFSTQWTVTAKEFTLSFATLVGGDSAAMNNALSPFFKQLQTLNISLTAKKTKVNPTFSDYYQYWITQPYSTNVSLGGRLIPRSAVKNSLPALTTAFQALVSDPKLPAVINGISSNVTAARTGNNPTSNAVLPAWRTSLFTMNVGVGILQNASWSVMQSDQVQLNKWQDQLRAITPDSGAYANEATFDNSNYKADYYGANYNKLLAIKTKYDPDGVLWSYAAVGSTQWSTDSDGRLCRTQY